MSVFTWGMLPKSQTDPEKIEEAIRRMIQEHNNDPEAHLGPSGSLQSHKAAEIIDHLAASIVADKIKNGEITSEKITTNQIVGKDFRTAENVGPDVDGVKFNSDGIELWQGGELKVKIPVFGDPIFRGILKVYVLDYLRDVLRGWFGNYTGWDTSGNITATPRGVSLATAAAVNSRACIYTDALQVGMNGSPFMQVKMWLSHNTNQIVYMVFGTSPEEYPDEDVNHIGWKVVNGTLYASVRKQGTERNFQISGVSLGNYQRHIFTVERKGDDYIKWYVDGELKYTLTENLPTEPTMGGDVYFSIQTTNSVIKRMGLQDLIAMKDFS